MTEDVQRTLGRIEGKLDSVLKARENDEERLDNHGERIGKLERWQSRVLGGMAVVAFLITVLVKVMK